MIADVPLGAFLSRWNRFLHHRGLMQLAKQPSGKDIHIGFHADNYNEAVHARKNRRTPGTEHTELYVIRGKQ